VVGASLYTAVTTALYTSAVMSLLIEVVAGLRAKQSGRELAVQILFGAMIGPLIIALRLILY
jgi:NADH:ubiquinone oxidoreductase subunit 6 (subunit J)